MHSRKSLLLSSTDVWIKDGDKDSDITVGSFDRAKICEIVHLYILHKLGGKYGKELTCTEITVQLALKILADQKQKE